MNPKFLKSEKFMICAVARHLVRDKEDKITDAEFCPIYLTGKGEWMTRINEAALVSYPQAGHDLLRSFPAEFKVEKDYVIVPNTIYFSKVSVTHQITRVDSETGEAEITFRVDGIDGDLPVDNTGTYIQRRIF
jgi:hypothetical protein